MEKVNNVDYQDLLKQIPDESVDLVLSDPPFGINYLNHYTHREHSNIIGDEAHFSYDILAKESYRILKPNTAILLFSCWSEYPKHYQQVEAAGFKMKEPIICQKRASGTTDLYGSFQSNADWVIFAHKGRFIFKPTQLVRNKRAGTIPNIGRKPVPDFKQRFPSCWFGEEYPFSSENPTYQKKNNLFHPTIKGLTFCKWLIQLFTDPDATVVDPFVGSGTTALAAKQLGRKWIVGEISEEYCKIANDRLK